MKNKINLVKENKIEFTKEMLEHSIFIMDNNFLMFPLKDYTISSELLEAFEKIADNTYIPFVTQVEFMENEKSVINKSKGNFEKKLALRKKILEVEHFISSKEVSNKIFNSIFNEIYRIKKEDDMRTFYDEINSIEKEFRSKVQERIDSSISELNSEINKQKEEFINKKINIPNQQGLNETTKLSLVTWMDKAKLGYPYSEEELVNYEKIISQRFEDRMSPGYADENDKQDKVITLGNRSINRSFSDALFWLDGLNYVEKNNIDKKYLVILSNEKKEDWVNDGKALSLNIDLFVECYSRTKMIAKKLDVWAFMKLMNINEKKINDSKINFDTNFSFSLYSQDYEVTNQREMMVLIFKSILKKESVNEYLGLPCLQLASDSSKNTIYNSFERLYDKDKREVLLGLTLNLKDKLAYIYRLLELRVPGSAPQLKFFDNEVQNQWTKVCKKMKKK